MRKRSVWKDTIRMTMVQFVLECLSLLFNAWMTRCIGAAIVGTLALAGSFFNLVSMAAGGNAMLCAIRFVSEELGKKNGNSRKILRYAISFCFTLSIPVACGIYCFAQSLGRQFLQSDEIENAVRLMACLLPVGRVSACLKGYFNAMCRVTVTAFCDVAEFFLRSGLLIILLQFHKEDDTEKICNYMVISMAAGTIFTGIILIVLYFRERNHTIGKSSISFGQYVKLAISVAFGGCLTSALSTANDTLIPKTLRQFGDSTSQALEQFGIFESIVIPVLFFPSTILCALSSILIPEVARAKAAGDQKRLQQLTELVIEWTLIFTVFIAAMFIRYGNWIGKWMDGGQLSGRMIQILAPVVPFIYLEIVLEALIKGMGRQNFSSLNYLIEYVIRICVLLIAVPIFGFYGIVASYYTSNVFGNCNRLRMLVKTAGLQFHFRKLICKPIFSALFAFLGSAQCSKCISNFGNQVLTMLFSCAITIFLYSLVLWLLGVGNKLQMMKHYKWSDI